MIQAYTRTIEGQTQIMVPASTNWWVNTQAAVAMRIPINGRIFTDHTDLLSKCDVLEF